MGWDPDTAGGTRVASPCLRVKAACSWSGRARCGGSLSCAGEAVRAWPQQRAVKFLLWALWPCSLPSPGLCDLLCGVGTAVATTSQGFGQRVVLVNSALCRPSYAEDWVDSYSRKPSWASGWGQHPSSDNSRSVPSSPLHGAEHQGPESLLLWSAVSTQSPGMPVADRH